MKEVTALEFYEMVDKNPQCFRDLTEPLAITEFVAIGSRCAQNLSNFLHFRGPNTGSNVSAEFHDCELTVSPKGIFHGAVTFNGCDIKTLENLNITQPDALGNALYLEGTTIQDKLTGTLPGAIITRTIDNPAYYEDERTYQFGSPYTYTDIKLDETLHITQPNNDGIYADLSGCVPDITIPTWAKGMVILPEIAPEDLRHGREYFQDDEHSLEMNLPTEEPLPIPTLANLDSLLDRWKDTKPHSVSHEHLIRRFTKIYQTPLGHSAPDPYDPVPLYIETQFTPAIRNYLNQLSPDAKLIFSLSFRNSLLFLENDRAIPDPDDANLIEDEEAGHYRYGRYDQSVLDSIDAFNAKHFNLNNQAIATLKNITPFLNHSFSTYITEVWPEVYPLEPSIRADLTGVMQSQNKTIAPEAQSLTKEEAHSNFLPIKQANPTPTIEPSNASTLSAPSPLSNNPENAKSNPARQLHSSPSLDHILPLIVEDAEVKKMLRALFESLPKDKRKTINEIVTKYYPAEEQAQQRYARAYEVLSQHTASSLYKQDTLLERFIEAIKSAWNQLTNSKALTPELQNEIIKRVFTLSMKQALRPPNLTPHTDNMDTLHITDQSRQSIETQLATFPHFFGNIQVETASIPDLSSVSLSGTYDASNLGLQSIDHLPLSCTGLKLSNNALTTLPQQLPDGLTHLDLSDNPITIIPPNLPLTLKYINLRNTQITSLDNIPPSVDVIHCEASNLQSIDKLPVHTEVIHFADTPIAKTLNKTLSLNINPTFEANISSCRQFSQTYGSYLKSQPGYEHQAEFHSNFAQHLEKDLALIQSYTLEAPTFQRTPPTRSIDIER